MNEPQDDEEFHECCECHKMTSDDKGEPCWDIVTNEELFICDECIAKEESELEDKTQW